MFRLLRPAVVALAILLLSGCVYLRLLDLRDQLADFDRYLTIDPGPSLRLGFRHPVLLAGDLDLLVGGPPTAVAPFPGGSVDVYAFQRAMFPGRGAPLLLLTVRHEAGRVVGIDLPEELGRVVPPALVVAGMRALGRARVDVGARRAEAALARDPGLPPIPTLADIEAVLGPPDGHATAPQGAVRWVWRYRLTSAPAVPCAVALDVRPGASRPSRVVVSVNGLWGSLDLP